MVTIASTRFEKMRKPVSFKVDLQLSNGLVKEPCLRIGIKDDTQPDQNNFTCGYLYDMQELKNNIFLGVMKGIGAFALTKEISKDDLLDSLHSDLEIGFELGWRKAKDILSRCQHGSEKGICPLCEEG